MTNQESETAEAALNATLDATLDAETNSRIAEEYVGLGDPEVALVHAVLAVADRLGAITKVLESVKREVHE
jgi:hypothetical protein